MRILHVSDFYLPRHGGVERVVEGLAREQLRAGDEPEVLTRRLTPGADPQVVVDGVPVRRLGRGPGPAPFHYPEVVRAARSWARSELGRFDLVHTHLTLTSLGVVAEASARGLPVVASFYGPWHREHLVEMGSGLGRGGAAGFMRLAQGRVLDGARRLVVLSAHSGGELAEFGYNDRSSPCRLVPGGVDPERFHPGARSQLADERLRGIEGPILLTVRRLVPRMGLDLLLDACARLRRHWPSLHLLVAGEGPLRAEIERGATSLGGVQVLGTVAEDDLPGLYARADLVVMPTRALEGFGLPVLEAWASGTPVVATPVGSLSELVGQAGRSWVASEATPSGLARAMERALETGKAAVSERLVTLAQSYRWSAVAARMRAVYAEALAASPA